MPDFELVYVAIVSGFFGIISLMLYQRGSLTNWGIKLDFMNSQMEHKERIESIKASKALQSIELKQKNPAGNNPLGALGNIDLDQVQDILEKAEGLGLTGEGGGGALGLLNNPVVKGLLQGASEKVAPGQPNIPKEFQNITFEE